MRTYYHVTPVRNLDSIREKGLLTEYATGARKAVWLVEAEKLPWAILHCAYRHETDVRSIAILTVYLKDAPFHHGKQLYFVREDIAPDDIDPNETWARELVS